MVTTREPNGTDAALGPPPSIVDLPPTISIEEAADLCGIGRNTAYRAAHCGELPSLRFGRRIRVPTARLLELLGVDSDLTAGDES